MGSTSGPSGAGWPLVVFLHGFGEKGNGNSELGRVTNACLPNLLAGTSLNALAVNQAIVVSPQVATSSGWSNPTEVNDGGRMENFLAFLTTTYGVDPQRIYVTGWSLGAGGVYDFTRNNPERVAAMAPMSGNGGTSAVLLDIPLWAFHHRSDPDAGQGSHLASINNYVTPSNGGIGTSPVGEDAFLVYRRSTDEKNWIIGPAIQDDPDLSITVRFSSFTGSTGNPHAYAWGQAYRSNVFWTWLLAQRKP